MNRRTEHNTGLTSPRGAQRQPPEPHIQDAGERSPPPSRATAVARDGVMITLRRYAAPGRCPVILLHGVFGNMNAWDLPIDACSHAKRLHQSGFDVWLVNYRNHGVGAYRSGTTVTGNCTIDDLAVLDVPAVVEHVTAVTFLRPFIIGHSMGGMVALMYLMGLQRTASGRIEISPALAKQSNRSVRGLCLLGTPLPLGWKDDPGLLAGLLRPRDDQNLLYRKIFGTKLAMKICDSINRLPVGTALAGPDVLARLVPIAGPAASRSLHKLLSRVANTRLFDMLWESSNMDREAVEAELRHAVNDVPAGILHQLCDWIRASAMREHPATAVDGQPCDYLPGLGLVTTPVLMVAGERDRSASAAVARDNFGKLGARDKRFHLMLGFGHNDLRIGKRAPQQLTPLLVRWLRHRHKDGATTRGIAA